jgi:hypothetical protein
MHFQKITIASFHITVKKFFFNEVKKIIIGAINHELNTHFQSRTESFLVTPYIQQLSTSLKEFTAAYLNKIKQLVGTSKSKFLLLAQNDDAVPLLLLIDPVR